MRRTGHEVLVSDFSGAASPKAVLATELFEVVRSGHDGGPARAESADQVERWLDGPGLTGAFHRATGRRGQKARLLVVLDQAEALLNRSEAEIEQAVALLFPEQRPPGLQVLLTLRADFMDAALNDPHLGFVLEQLWERQVTGRLQVAAYEELGGVSGALRRHAEAGEGRWRLVRALAEWCLLVLYGGDGRPKGAELSHEALITAWPALAEEVRASADFLAGRVEVQHDLERWQQADASPALLPGRRQLAALEARLRGRETDLTAEQRDFLDRARRRRRAQRVQRVQRRAGWLAGALVLALVAGPGTFLVQQSHVTAQRAAEGRSRTLAIQSGELTKTVSGGRLQLFHLDPAQWKRHLCSLLGRGLTADERGSLPAELCPAGRRQGTATP